MYERDGGISLDRVFYLVNVHSSFVEEMVEDVVSFESFFSVLFVPKDEVNPLVEVGGDIVTFQSLEKSSIQTIVMPSRHMTQYEMHIIIICSIDQEYILSHIIWKRSLRIGHCKCVTFMLNY